MFRMCCVAALSLAPVCVAQQDPQAHALLEQAAEAVKRSTSLSFRATLRGEGTLFGSVVPKISNSVIMMRNPERPELWMVRSEGTADISTKGAVPFLTTTDGVTRQWVDDKKKQVLERPVGSSKSAASDFANLATIPELSEASPFSKSLAAPGATLEATTEADGQPCDVVLVDLGGSQHRQRWVIGQDDHLPRRLEKIYKGQAEGQEEKHVIQITDLQRDPTVNRAIFQVPVPEGYTKEEHHTVPMRPNPAAPAPGDPGAAEPAAPPAPAKVIGAAVGDIAPDWELAGPDGKKVKLSELRGNVVLMDFWGTWCLPCRKAGPEVQKLAEKYKDKPVKIFGLAVKERTDEAAIAHFKEKGYTYGLLLKADDVAKLFKVSAYPTYFVISPTGDVLHFASGYEPDKTFPAIEKVIDENLAAGHTDSSQDR